MRYDTKATYKFTEFKKMDYQCDGCGNNKPVGKVVCSNCMGDYLDTDLSPQDWFESREWKNI